MPPDIPIRPAAANAGWLRFLPRLVRARLEGRHGLQAILGNSSWLVADKIIRLGVGLLVGVWVARYLGPEGLGILSYAGAFGGLFGTFASLGLDNIVIRELLKDPTREARLLGSAFVLKLIGAVVTIVITLVAITLLRPGDTLTFWLVGCVVAGFVFQSFNVIDFYFQATVQSKYTVYAANAAFILMTLVKIVMLLTSASLIGFGLVGLGEVILASGFLILGYRRNHRSVRAWRYDGKIARELLSHSWPLILSGLTVMIYMRIDQIMIGQMLGDKEVGLFAVAVRLSEIWYFVPMSIASSVFPAIINAKKQNDALYRARIQQLYDLMTWMGISVAVATTLLAPYVIHLLYGSAYAESAQVLTLQIWAGVAVCMSFAHGKWLIAENLQKYSMYYTAIGAVLNVSFNLVLIPAYGIKGAAMATLIAQFSPNLLQLFLKPARANLLMMVKSFAAPVRFAMGQLEKRRLP